MNWAGIPGVGSMDLFWVFSETWPIYTLEGWSWQGRVWEAAVGDWAGDDNGLYRIRVAKGHD